MSDTDTDPETTWAFASLAISEVTARLDDDSDWRIIDSSAAHITTAAGRRGRIYWDETTPDDEGWAYQLEATEDDPEQSGPLNSFGDLAVFEAATVVSDGAEVAAKASPSPIGSLAVQLPSQFASLAVTVTKTGRSTRWAVNLAGAVAGLGDLRAGTLSVTDAGLAEYDEADDTDALAVRQGTNRAVRWCAGFTPQQGKWAGSKDVESPAAAVSDIEAAIWGDAIYDPKDARTRWLLSVLGLR